ncbi:MAG: surface protein [Flavipsychrobacter sp.]|jgi:hypothetical protein|nr:surface protein [Flavipsychrobacter sp.]
MTKRFLLFGLVFLFSSLIHVRAITGPSAVCIGSTIALSDTAAGGTWSSSNPAVATVGSSIGSVTGVSAGIATITYTTGSGFATIDITVESFPNPGTITGPDSLCAWAPALYANIAPGGTWAVSNGKGTVDSAGNFTGMFAGLDTLFYVVTNSCGSDTAAKEIKIKPLAEADMIFAPAGVCVGDTISLMVTVPGGTWHVTNPTAQLIDTAKLIGISPGADTVFYRVENSCSADTAVRVFTVTAYPSAGSITGPSVLCVNQTITLTDTMKNGVWRNRNSNTAISGALIVTGVKEGLDTISYTVTNTCATDSVTWPLVINPQPAIPAITRTGNVLAAPAGHTAYQWLLLGNPIPGATNNTVTATTLGSYYVIVSNTYSCSITSFPQTITEIKCNPEDLRIYPNPTSSTLHLGWCKPVNTRLTGTDGKTIKTEHINQLDLTPLPNGIYQLSVFDELGNKLRTETITKLRQ